MKCKVCGKTYSNMKKMKDGPVCLECIKSMTPLIRDNPSAARNLTLDEIKKVNRILTRGTEPPFCHWSDMYICEHAIQVNSWEIKLKQIKSIELDFHPKGYGNGDHKVLGDMVLKIETVKPCIKVEDIIARDIQTEYRIAGKEIKYIFPNAVVNMLNRLKATINSKRYSMEDLKEEMRIKSARKEQQAKKKQQNTEFDRAKQLFNIDIPYTLAQLKDRRNQLIKANHPDQGGSAEKCAEINTAFELLERFAAK